MRTDVPTAYLAYFKSHPEDTTFAEQAARTVEVPNGPNSVEIWQTFRDAYSQAVIFGSLPSDSWLVANLRKSHAVARVGLENPDSRREQVFRTIRRCSSCSG
jgi:multiple sugar transport system substrate-binding protein